MLTIWFVFTLLLLLLIELIFNIWKRRKLPPGPAVRWPIIGNLIEMIQADANYPHIAFAKMAMKYGDIMSFGFGVHDAVVVSSYEAMKDLFTREDLCSSRYEFPYVLDRAFQKNLGVIWCNNQVWREMRRFTFKTLKNFGLGKSKSMEARIQEETDDMIELIRSNSEKNEGVFLLDHQALTSHSVNILWNFVGGFRFPPGDEKLAKMLKYNELGVQIYGHKNVISTFPFLKKWFPKYSQHDNHMKMYRDTHDFFTEVIEVIKQKRVDRLNKNADNFVEAFLDEIEKNTGNPESPFTEEQLNVILSDLFLGGSETVSTTLKWAILFLTMNPHVQHKIQTEIKSIVGRDNPVSLNHAARLPYLKATIFEVLRMGLVTPVPLPRKAMTDIHYNGYTIPKGSCVFFNLYTSMNDTKYWKDPEVFRPDRFLDADGLKVVNTERVNSFGFGKRICPGENFAMDSLIMFVSNLLQNFTFEAIAGEKLSVDNPIPGIAIAPKPYRVKVIIN